MNRKNLNYMINMEIMKIIMFYMKVIKFHLILFHLKILLYNNFKRNFKEY